MEAGKTYYYRVEYKAEGKQYGTAEELNYQVKKKVSFALLNEDGGKYRVKAIGPEYASPEEVETWPQLFRAIIDRLFGKDASSSSVRHPRCALLAKC